MLQKSLGYAINKFRRFCRVPEKNRHFQENYKICNTKHNSSIEEFMDGIVQVKLLPTKEMTKYSNSGIT